MKTVARLIGVVTMGCLFPAAAQSVTEPKTKHPTSDRTSERTERTTPGERNTERTERTTGDTERSTERTTPGTKETTTTTTTFTPDARTKVVKYFDEFKSSPHGLPPQWASKIKVKEVPQAWKTSRIAPGMVISDKDRSYLVDAPPELVQLLPAPAGDVTYYIAGSNVIAVDKTSYRVVDSLRIPSIKFEMDD